MYNQNIRPKNVGAEYFKRVNMHTKISQFDVWKNIYKTATSARLAFLISIFPFIIYSNILHASCIVHTRFQRFISTNHEQKTK